MTKEEQLLLPCVEEVDISENMLEFAKEEGYDTTENFSKIARAKQRFFGIAKWRRCPCDGNNPDRYCGSDLCKADIKRDGICHCHCYKLKEN